MFPSVGDPDHDMRERERRAGPGVSTDQILLSPGGDVCDEKCSLCSPGDCLLTPRQTPQS